MARSKVAITVDRGLLERIEEIRRSRPDRPSRSRMFEEALRAWWEAQEKARIDREVEAYYLALNEEERREEEAWAEGSSRAATENWED